MNTRWLVALSLVLNAALLVLARPTAARPETSRSGTTQPEAEAETFQARTNLMRMEVTETNQATPFHWRDVESEDLHEFAANLRGIGCPPETLRAIIEGELWARFLPRRRALLEPFQRQYWDYAASDPGLDSVPKLFREQMDKLREETIGKLDEIAGKPPPSPEKPRHDPQLDFLPESKQRELEALEKRFSEEMAKLRPAEPQKMTPELRAKREEMQAQHQAAIRAAMTSEELAEYQLRRSRYAGTAQTATGFDATPDEMRAVTRIYEQFQTADARPDGKDPNAATKKAQIEEAKKQREAALKQALPAERYAQFQEGLDGNFQQFYHITERYELPRETASAAASVLRTSQERLNQLPKENAQPAPETAQSRLAIQTETRDALLRVLGERVLRTYEKYHGPIIPAPEEVEAR